MNENFIGSLFNRAILDTLIGFLSLIITNLLIVIISNINFIILLLNSPYSHFFIWIILIVSYLFGHFFDKLTFLILDHGIYSKQFQTRFSRFDLPSWCQKEIELRITQKLDIKSSKTHNLIDDSKTDWIAAYFLTKARPEAIQKRTDLVANYQFVSNILMILVYAFFVIPSFWYFHESLIINTISSLIILLIAIILYWTFSLSALARIHTFENLIVYGLIIEESKKGIKDIPSASLPQIQSSKMKSLMSIIRFIFK
jgi:hypothetical protein